MPAMGATLEGQFDYQHDDVRLRGTFIPAYALNNFLARVPLIGDILGGGKNEGGGYSDIDMIFTPEGTYAHKDGSPYDDAKRLA